MRGNKNMKKIGIITLYYNNDNYGGIAQSYALNRYIEKLGFDSELISYKRSPVHIPNLRERMVWILLSRNLCTLWMEMARQWIYSYMYTLIKLY